VKVGPVIRVVIFGVLVILAIIGIQSYWIMNTWNVKEQEFHERAVYALSNVAKEFEKLGSQLPAFDLIKRITSNYYVVNVNDVINPNNLEYFLRRELEEVGLNEDFEYGIYDCGTGKMVYGDYITYSTSSDTTGIIKDDLPIYDEYIYYFGVRFPNRNSQILSNMGITIVFAVILLVTVAFFFASIFIMVRQKRLSEMQKDFINNMTHEFKTPISTIKISADVFLNNSSVQADPRLRQYASIIKDQNRRLNHQVEKVLQIAKVERGNIKLNPEPINLPPFLKETLQGTQLKIKETGGQLSITICSENQEITADKLHLSNVLHNLLDNAVKYCKEAPDIHLNCQDKGHYILLSIQDNGIGIAQEYQAKVFKKFFRVPTGNIHDVKGFGLGLFYIRKICQAQGWKVFLESEPGKGTVISLKIPKRRKAKPSIRSRLFRKFQPTGKSVSYE
jgi:two-component system phosphate regulon sensor histidine kinase PhoR